MKKLLVIITFLFFALPGYSQMFGWGITLGPNMSSAAGKDFDGNAFVGTELITAFHGGLIVQFRPRRFFTIYSGMEYVMKGSNFSSGRNSLGYSSNNNQLRLNYLEVPLFMKINFDQYSDIRPNVFAGPTFGFLLSGKDNYLLPINATELSKPLLDTESNYKSFDPGLAFGAGLDIDVGEWTIFTMGAQYVLGMRNVADPESVFVDEDYEVKNRNFRLNMGLIFVIPTYTMNTKGKKDLGFKKFHKHLVK